MARQQIDIGVQGNDGTGDSIRTAFDKVNQNFTQLYAIFGLSGTIKFTNLDDAPATYGAEQVFISNSDATALLAKSLVGGTGIQVDNTDPNEIRIISTGGKIGNDVKPSLGNHLNAERFSIGNLADATDETATAFNTVHDTTITADNLVVTRGFADQRYLQSSGQTGVGVQVRVRDEPLDVNAYTIVISNWSNGYANITNHGYNTGSNGIAVRYIASIAPAGNLISNTVYYLRYIDKNRMAVYATQVGAITGGTRIIVNDPGVDTRGTEVFQDANYDSTLLGNWLSDEALPRKSAVRRQGDRMEGSLLLSDHPGSLAGQGTPNGADDLQAATKFYVDNSSFASESNLFVAKSGDDLQKNTPPGKEGRAFAYAFATLNAACRYAEQIISQARAEPGPYRQLLNFSSYTNIAYLNSIVVGAGNARTLNVYTNGLGVDQSKDVTNRDLREGSIIRGVNSGATGKVIAYGGIVSVNDVYSVELLHYTSDKVYFQTNYVNVAATLNANRAFIANEVVEFVKAKYPALPISFQTRCRKDVGLIVDAVAFDTQYGGNTHTIKAAGSYWSGVTSTLPLDQRAPTIDAMDYVNQLAQSIINNTTVAAANPASIPPGFGKRGLIAQQSGAAGETASGPLIERLINSIKDIITNGLSGGGVLLEFFQGEPLEYGQPVSETHITIRVESGVYYEQYPIRVPVNVSVKGDEFRRVIIRPAPGISTSPWAGLHFYRDDNFDGLTRTFTSNALTASSSGTTITLATGTTFGLQIGMHMSLLAGTGRFAPNTVVTEFVNTTSFKVNQAPTIALVAATIRGLNNYNLAPTGQNYGYHYLNDPTGISGVFNVIPTSGNTIAAGLIAAARTSIQTNVINYINSTYPSPGYVYNVETCRRDVGYIVDAVVYDITYGGVVRSRAAAGAYKLNASGITAITTQLTQTIDGIARINTAMQAALSGGSPEVSAAGYVSSLIDGIKASIIGVNNPPKNNKDMDVFLLNDGTIIRNLTAQGHGGFMCVLDPEGQIQTKSPYFQTATSVSGSLGNVPIFGGGYLVDGFVGNLQATITGRNSSTEVTVGGLYIRAPGIPTAIVIGSKSYQLNAVKNYNRSAGTATITLDASTPWPVNNPATSALWAYPYNVVIQTPGNKSMLGNDFTQVNDLGYGIIATNNGLVEAVSVFTYYCQVGYFSNNGGQIRSIAGSTCYGVYGLKARGSDPNEVPDQVYLGDNTVQVAKIFKRNTYAGRNVAGEQAIYIDNYDYVPFNISELEIDHSNTKSRIVENTPLLPNNIAIAAAGTGYAIGDFVDFDGGTLYPGGVKTRLRVTTISGGATGPVTGFEITESGLYSVNPVGGWPTTRGTVTTTRVGGSGTGLTITASYLGDITTYEISNVERTTVIGLGVAPGGAGTTRTVIKCNLNTQASATMAGALSSSLVDGQTVIIRLLQNFRFTQVYQIRPVRPSTAMEFKTAAESGIVYRTLAYTPTYADGTPLPANQAVLSFDNSFNYVIMQSSPADVTDAAYAAGGTTMGGTIGDTKIAIQTINTPSAVARLNSGNMLFGWAGKLHRITGYVAAAGANSAYITFTDYAYGSGSIVNVSGLATALSPYTAINLRAGLVSGVEGAITVNISTCRATGHDFLDIGTGSYNSSNYPNNVFGGPAHGVDFAQAVIEETSGRVFHASTDQDGIFRVGKFFAVDQGTGTVTFSASIALSNLDGLGFKKGVVVKEFSTDNSMGSNSDNIVSVQSAVRQYIEKRLGYTHDGSIIPLADRIPANTGGFLPISGTPVLEANLSMGSTTGHRITNLVPNVDSNTDASTIGYVNSTVANYDTWYKLDEVLVDSPAVGDIAVFTGAGRTVTTGTITGDIAATFDSINKSTLVGGITTPPTIDSGIPATSQSKVSGGVIIADITGWPISGYFQIDNEIFSYTSITSVSNKFNGVTRAKIQTTAAVHNAGATVYGLNNASLNLQIGTGAIINTDISASAAIAQSKLSMNNATANTSAIAVKGIASFDGANFETNGSGWVSIKSGGVALSEITTIAAGSILGNLTNAAAVVAEVTTSGIVQNGINTLFSAVDTGGGNVLVRRTGSLNTTTQFSSLIGNAITGNGTFTNVPVTSVAANGFGAVVDVDRSGGSYTGIYVRVGTSHGQNYSEGDLLLIPGTLLGGTSPTNDLNFAIAINAGTNIDSTVYLGMEKITIEGAANSIVKTDSLGNLGNVAHKFNTIYATSFNGTVTNAALAENIAGGVKGSIPYQNSPNDTVLLSPGAAGKFLKSQGPNAAPTWETVVQGGGAGSYTDLTVSGHLTLSVDSGVIAAGTTQSTASIIYKDINVVTGNLDEGVILPSAVAGYKIIVRNSGSFAINVYPNTGDDINTGVENEAVQLPPGASLEYFCTTTSTATGSSGGTQGGGHWFNLNATFA